MHGQTGGLVQDRKARVGEQHLGRHGRAPGGVLASNAGFSTIFAAMLPAQASRNSAITDQAAADGQRRARNAVTALPVAMIAQRTTPPARTMNIIQHVAPPSAKRNQRR